MSIYSSTVLADNPLGYWRLADVGSTAADVSGNSHPGTLIGGVTTGVAGALTADGDNGMTFDGTSGYIDIGNAAAFQLTTVTLEAWAKNVSNDGFTHTAFGKSLAWTLLQMPNSNFGVYDWNVAGYSDSGVAINDGQWHHLVASIQSGVAGGTKLYVDGLLKLTGILTVNSQADNLLVAANDVVGGFPQYWNGSIDEVAIYNYVLTQAQVATHWTIGTTPPASLTPVVVVSSTTSA